jgi:hypothetical protein
MAGASPIRAAARRHRSLGGRAPGALRPVSSARKASHQRVPLLCVRKPPEPTGFRETASGGIPHLDRACRIRDESFGQSPIEQKAANALESGRGPLSAASPRRDAKRNSTRRLSNRKPSIPATFWIPLCGLRLDAPPYMDAPTMPSTLSGSGITGRDCSHTSGLSMRRLAAGPDGICWSTPDHIRGLAKSRGGVRLSRPRSDL